MSPDTGISMKRKLSTSLTEDIFYVNQNGNAYFKGSISADSGKLGGWDISSNGLSHSSGQYYLRADGTGKIGLMTFTNTSATFDGNIYAKNLRAGNTTLSDGSYGNAGYVGDSHIADNSISGTKLRAEYRDSVTHAISAVQVYADNTFATNLSFSQFQSNVNNQISTAATSILQTTAATYATINSVAQYQNSVNNSIASITQDVSANSSKISLVVGSGKLIDNSGNASASIIINAINGSSSAIISADKINLNGYVTFNSLSTPGATTINGNNITTGTIKVERLEASGGAIVMTRDIQFTTGSQGRVGNVTAIGLSNGVSLKPHSSGAATFEGASNLYLGSYTVLHSGNYQNYLGNVTAKFG